MISLDRQTAFLTLATPPVGYRLGYCIGATFSADIGCLLQLACNATKSANRPTDTLDPTNLGVLQDFESRAAIFFQGCRLKDDPKGQLAKPGFQKLLCLLDSILIPIPAPGRHSVFHPKVWLLRFDSEDSLSPVFKLIVMSRNLTPSLDWDVSCTLFGEKGRVEDKNRNLCEFLRCLLDQAVRHRNGKAARLIRLALQDVPKIRFISPRPLGSSSFLFQWPSKASWRIIRPEDYSELIIVSPFLGKSPALLKKLLKAGRVTLITTAQDLSVLKNLPILQDRTYVMKTASENEFPDGPRHGLHAKIYLGLRRGGRTADVFVGSANCTEAAFEGRNVEAMSRFSGPGSLVRQFEKDFIFEEGMRPRAYLTRYADVDQSEYGESSIDKVCEKLEAARNLIATGTFVLTHKAHRAVVLIGYRSQTRVSLPVGIRASYRLLSTEKDSPLGPLLSGIQQSKPSDGIPSDFVIVTLRYEAQILRFWTVARSNLDRSGRARQIQKAAIATPDDFMRLIAAILGDERVIKHGGNDGDADSDETKSHAARPVVPTADSLLELLLLRTSIDETTEDVIEQALAACRQNGGKRIEKLDHFERLWLLFKQAKRELKRG